MNRSTHEPVVPADPFELLPDNDLLNSNLAAALLERQDWSGSEAASRQAIALRPDNAVAFANYGTALLRLGRHAEALVACREALRLGPDGVAMHESLGGAMVELGASLEAVDLCRRAIALDPDRASAYFNLSHAYKAMNELAEAETAARRAIGLCPDLAEYHFQLAHILLLRGNYAEGWAEYDWRWKLPDFGWIKSLDGASARRFWNGEDIRGKSILIYTEQGLGDIILCARYLPPLVRIAGRVIVMVNPQMRRLLSTIQGTEIVTCQDVVKLDYDAHCPLLSLPRAFGTLPNSIPADTPYLGVDPAARSRWISRIGGTALKVGIVWAGNPATKRDHLRSPGLASVMPLFSVPGITFIALQVPSPPRTSDTDALPSHVLDLGSEIEDLSDTAAIIAGLDLMISSCTAPLHLAGALGVPTWAMIPFAPYFPWFLDRTNSPWYPSLRLYRQDQPGGDWSAVVERIAVDLAAMARSRRAFDPASPAMEPSPQADTSPDASNPVLPGDPDTLTAGLGRDEFNQLSVCRAGSMLYNRNDTFIGASLKKYGEYSAEETALFRLIIQPGRTVLDVGANIGAHTIEFSILAGRSGTVHAFEPQRLVFQLLCANVALNSRANVFAHQVAVGAAPGSLLVPPLDPNRPHNHGGLSLLANGQGEPVRMVTIDELDLRDCQFIKLDIEGMEADALRGATRTIDKFRPILYVENDRQARCADLIDLLMRTGYRLYWHLPPLFNPNNFRSDPENIFGGAVSVNMICIPAEIPQSALTNLREVSGPSDSVIQW